MVSVTLPTHFSHAHERRQSLPLQSAGKRRRERTEAAQRLGGQPGDHGWSEILLGPERRSGQKQNASRQGKEAAEFKEEHGGSVLELRQRCDALALQMVRVSAQIGRRWDQLDLNERKAGFLGGVPHLYSSSNGAELGETCRLLPRERWKQKRDTIEVFVARMSCPTLLGTHFYQLCYAAFHSL